ncbi:MAG: (2Fe-2S) ferredoxin domain-containing protein [Chloroflexi bacterium]|jgi:NADP-reducing hydrogenase subunit HndB|nr:(2Fe-2S) ferredoxin domain-containing protein [Anaerolineaceae bacterium]NLI45039.1 (2Fe-2S) ferredoxin domain-containing protein [Chloroflexota bacterium]HOE34518.1 (2Fe-2S) ferredoxin domain-containing protein [Anaerolineaceae bacterium]HOT25068.1 (2Fe-2S) ferredoxin domain-containing protein [Anaerolineaceae bacterium]HQK03491.1 (2Fe-2S) ferredoxin domain-containing protein [Anaerolineaceae bacterium]
MPTIKSLEDLKKMREEALRKQELKTTTGKTEIIVGMGTVGIAAGARETLKAILEFVDSNHLENIIIRQTGNIGIDSFEPVVQVVLPGQEKVTYGHVNPEIAKIIMEEHVVRGKVVPDYQIKG